MTNDDMALVREYARSNSETAFATLVTRHVNLVYSVAMRQTRDPHLAQEITQAVFIVLAKKADSLSANTILAAWLCRTAHFISSRSLRDDRRRQSREREAQMQSMLNEPDPGVWHKIAPLLDDAMSCLAANEHDAVVLRFFKGMGLREVGTALGITEDAARMRVNRGLDKLRNFFTQRGVTLSTTAIAGAVAANSIQAAPAGLAAIITAGTISGTTITSAAVIAATKSTAMTTLPKWTFALAIAAATGMGVYEAHQASQFRGQVEALKNQQSPLVQQVAALQTERDAATNKLTAMAENMARLNGENSELLRLRGELTLLRQRSTELSNQLAKVPNRWGLQDDQMPPVSSSGVPETAQAYARLIKKLSTGQLSAAEEFNLLKAWPYLERRFSEPQDFAFFQAEYLSSILSTKDDNVKWQLRQVLEQARNEEHAHGLRWARKSEDEVQSSLVEKKIEQIREDWNTLNATTREKIARLISDSDKSSLLAECPILDFDPRLKSGSNADLSDPRFKNLNPNEVFQAFFPPNGSVRYVPARRISK